MKLKSESRTIDKGINLGVLSTVASSLDSEIKLYEEIVRGFERKHGKLEEFEKKLNVAEIEEHPNWEESIEWRNAIEEMEKFKMVKGVLNWTFRFLKQHKSLLRNANM